MGRIIYKKAIVVANEIGPSEEYKKPQKAIRNPFEMAKQQIDIVAKEMRLDENITKYLKRVERSLIVSIPVIMDNGEVFDFLPMCV